MKRETLEVPMNQFREVAPNLYRYFLDDQPQDTYLYLSRER